MIAPVYRRAASALVGAAIACVALAGCSASPTAAVENYQGTPSNVDDVALDDQGFGGAWLDDGSSFAVTISGSSSCPPTGESYTVSGENAITVTLVAIKDDQACTMDLVPHTTVFTAVDELEDGQELTVTVDSSSFTIPARS